MNNYQPMYGNFGMYGNRNFGYQYQPNQNIQQPQQPIQPIQPITTSLGLQGKSVDSIDVVKAMDIPLDGSVSYFPLTNGTAIITKQLQQDGTSKTIIYKPIQEEQEKKEEVKIDYLTKDDLDNTLRNEMNNVKNQIQIISENINELVNEMKNFKGGKK
jgi:hypothetical protein